MAKNVPCPVPASDLAPTLALFPNAAPSPFSALAPGTTKLLLVPFMTFSFNLKLRFCRGHAYKVAHSSSQDRRFSSFRSGVRRLRPIGLFNPARRRLVEN